MLEAVFFLAGAVLFFLAVVFFVFLWQDRMALARRKSDILLRLAELEQVKGALKEQRVEMDIREHELLVWAEGLEHQQLALEQAEEQLRMLTASKQPLPSAVERSSDVQSASSSGGIVKNVKLQRDSAKMPK